MMKSQYFRPNLLILIILSQMLFGCSEIADENDNNTITSQQSEILPPTLLLNNLKPITLLQPANGQAYYIDERDTTDLTFEFDASEPHFSALYLFKNIPQTSNNVITNGNSACLGGITNMAPTHNWQNTKTQLSVSSDNSYIFQCNTNNNFEVFSVDQKLALDEINFPKNTTVYWAILGYNAQYQLTHSSNIQKINIK